MIAEQLREYIGHGRTLLCVGPMSKNCVDVTIDLANLHQIPLTFIASRRQIECAEMGGGYVENWSTQDFVKYVRARDRGGYVVLARDHGDLEHPEEASLGLGEAMASAARSYRVDIESGLQLIHLDPSLDPAGEPSVDELINRIFELYGNCWETVRQHNLDVAFEIGTEEQRDQNHSVGELEYILSRVTSRCHELKLPLPLFVVCQTGTKVMERRNVGLFEETLQQGAGPGVGVAVGVEAGAGGEGEGGTGARQIQDLLQLCQRYNILMKEHNADYLSDAALAMHPRLGIHAANVAPEFGVAETLAWLKILSEQGLMDFKGSTGRSCSSATPTAARSLPRPARLTTWSALSTSPGSLPTKVRT